MSASEIKELEGRTTGLIDLPTHILVIVASNVRSPSDLCALACTNRAMSEICAFPDLTAAWLLNPSLSHVTYTRQSRCDLYVYFRALRAWQCSASVAQHILTRSERLGLHARMGPWTTCCTARDQALAQWLLDWALQSSSSVRDCTGIDSGTINSSQGQSPDHGVGHKHPQPGIHTQILDWALSLSDASSQAEAVRRHGEGFISMASEALQTASSIGAIWAVEKLTRAEPLIRLLPLRQTHNALRTALRLGHEDIALLLLRTLMFRSGLKATPGVLSKGCEQTRPLVTTSNVAEKDNSADREEHPSVDNVTRIGHFQARFQTINASLPIGSQDSMVMVALKFDSPEIFLAAAVKGGSR